MCDAICAGPAVSISLHEVMNQPTVALAQEKSGVRLFVRVELILVVI